MTLASSAPLPSPRPVAADASMISVGLPIPAIERIRVMSSGQWEDFVLEWAHSRSADYLSMERCGGAGDMGRDVIGLVDQSGDVWDNYQCKHYDHGLWPSDVWCELGKLVYYTSQGAFTVPRTYTFVSPHGAGTTLSNLLRTADKLREGLIDNWDQYCRTGITATAKIELDGALLRHLQSIDFGIFRAIPPLTLIDEHCNSPYHAARFGGGLPARPAVPTPPPEIQQNEAPYVDAILAAYSERLATQVRSRSDLDSHNGLAEHFDDARFEFYSAEALRSFSRDHLPDGEFARLQADVHHGIKPELRSTTHADGLDRLDAVVSRSHLLPLHAHSLATRLSVLDRGGICHQLANDDKIAWVIN